MFINVKKTETIKNDIGYKNYIAWLDGLCNLNVHGNWLIVYPVHTCSRLLQFPSSI